MDFFSFTDKIDILSSKKLGGLTSQLKMMPKLRIHFSEEEIQNKTPKKAAVLALIYPDEKNNAKILLTKRASYKGTHSAQISFPGGKIEKTDTNLKETALRETYEEVGISSENIKILKALSPTYIPPSNFLVSPFIGIINHTPIFKKNYEVADIIDVLLDDLLDTKNSTSTVLNTSYQKNMKVPCFKLNDYLVWGATAMILSEIKDLIK